MNRTKLVFWLIGFALIIDINTMKAQTKAGNGDALSPQQKGIVTIAALTANGDIDRLKTALPAALEAGLSINEIKEELTQLYAYCGFPRSLNAIGVFKTVLEERKAKGIIDPEGKPILVENNVNDKYEQGRKVLETLTNTPQPKPAPGFGAFAPRIDAFLKEHLFADIFASDILTYEQRELATIAALAAMPGVTSQLQAHIGMGRNTGINEKQLEKTFDLIEKHIGQQQAESARAVLLKMKTQ
ncbi:MAG TPA: carboxymuconolactone decarboxylase family protein [Mucilaginibacter sp.]|nr:carboxymuconolactone decarboxylase family protein [Mucilaginibacter sp.]